MKPPATAPCLLGGWSYGGILAFCLAKLLIESGRSVPALIMFDSSPVPDSLRSAVLKCFPKLETLFLNDHASVRGAPRNLRREVEECKSYSPTDRLILGMRSEAEFSDLAGFVLRGKNVDFGLRSPGESDFQFLERLATVVEAVDGELFRQMFIPGQSGPRLHRAALVFKNNLLDALSFTSDWVFPGEICIFCQKGHPDVGKWQRYSSRPVQIFEYPIQPLAGKDSHTSMMDEPNIKLFAKDLCAYMQELDKTVLSGFSPGTDYYATAT
jgi:hypothetical protein